MYTKCVGERRELKQHTIYKSGKIDFIFYTEPDKKRGFIYSGLLVSTYSHKQALTLTVEVSHCLEDKQAPVYYLTSWLQAGL